MFFFKFKEKVEFLIFLAVLVRKDFVGFREVVWVKKDVELLRVVGDKFAFLGVEE